jgi:MFS family permease
MNGAITTQRSIGPIKLSPGVTPAQIAIFVFVVLTATCIVGFITLIQPYVFTEMLHIPTREQGRLAGNLATVQQIAVLIFITVSGSLADLIGRKAVLILALTGFVLTCLIYPLLSSVWSLYGVRFFLGMSQTGHTAGGQTMMVDYPDNRSRGKFIGLMLIVQGFGAAILVGWLGARVPGWLVNSGISPAIAGRYVFWAAATLGILGIVTAALFLKDRPRRRGQTDAARFSIADIFRNFGLILRHAKRNPRFALVLVMGFVTRSDFTIVQSFLSLWIVSAARDVGAGTTGALKTAGLMTLILQIAMIATPALFGLIADRVNRSRVLIISCGAAGLSFMSTWFVHDVFGIAIIGVVALIGIAEGAQTVGVNAVLGEEAPEDLRGATVGVFVFLGSISVVVVSFVGGQLFDRVGYVAPFVVVGAINIVFAIVALAITERPGHGGVVTQAG